MGKLPLIKMPLNDVQFQRVAVDLIGPTSLVSESGERYVLTIMEFATRYPEAVALKTIEA